MVRVLCNRPLDQFDARENMRGVDLVTFGSPRADLAAAQPPCDIAFDAAGGSLDELFALLPAGWRPDIVLIWGPDQEPLPRGLHRCPVPVVGVIADYDRSLATTGNLQPFFDVVLCDRGGVELFEALGHPDVRAFCQYTFTRRLHFPHQGVARDLDIAFASTLTPAVQRARAPWIARLADLAAHGLSVELRHGVAPAAYGHLLSRARIGFNRSLRGEMNARAFEVPACGAVLLMERDNREVRNFFVDGEECVLHGDDDFEDVVVALARDKERLQRIARAGHRRVQDHSMGRRLPQMLELLARPGPGRPASDDATAALGRAEAMLGAPVPPAAKVRAAAEAARLAPASAAAQNALALATLALRGDGDGVETLDLLRRAAAKDPHYVPAQRSLAALLSRSDRPDLAAAAHDEARRRMAAARSCGDLAGPSLPCGRAEDATAWSMELQRAVRGRSARQPIA